MNSVQLAWYLEAIKHEVELINDNFVGSISFKMNIKLRSIANMNIDQIKSVQMPEVK